MRIAMICWLMSALSLHCPARFSSSMEKRNRPSRLEPRSKPNIRRSMFRYPIKAVSMKFKAMHPTPAEGQRDTLLVLILSCVSFLITGYLSAGAAELRQDRQRLRDLGILVGQYQPGPLNAITDVEGVRVGHTTLIRGEGPLQPGEGPVRTGVTVVIPREDVWNKKVAAGAFVLNGTGEMTGLSWIAG